MKRRDSSNPLIRFDRLTKRFPGVVALDAVSFGVAPGSVHALVGENGAGKSTLGKTLAGIHQPDGGTIFLDDKPLKIADPRQALQRGIGIVHQELAFCENLTVAENLCLADLPRCARWFVSGSSLRRRARAMLQAIGVDLDERRRVGDLSVARQQMVQIAQAVAVGARVIVFDEPTSSLSQRESRRLFDLIATLRQRGVTMLYVSHRLEEVFRLCDTITVLRDGQHVATRPTGQVTTEELVRMMIGRPLAEYFPKHLEAQVGPEVLRVERFSSPGRFTDVSLNVHAGEVVGLAGLVGAGRSEVAQAIFGLDRRARGRVLLHNRPVPLGRPASVIARGAAMTPEDRKRQGLVMTMNCMDNLALTVLKRHAIGPFVNLRKQARLARQFFRRLDVRAPGIRAPVVSLSGGNQQKIVLAKWLATRPGLLIVDEPTRGVDVGAKAQIHALIDELARQGTAVLLISSELPELLSLATRIVVLRGGKVIGELPRESATQERLLQLMADVRPGLASST